MGASPSAAAHTGVLSSQRAMIPAATPQGAKSSKRPRSRSKATTRGKNIVASSLRNGQWRMPSSAAALEAHDEGGSTTSIARRSRQNRPATSSVERPTSVSRVSGGIHSRLMSGADCNAKRPAPVWAEPMMS
jgi:hypothetical protein